MLGNIYSQEGRHVRVVLVEVIYIYAWLVGLIFGYSWSNGRASNLGRGYQMSIYMGPMEALRPRARVLARACSFRSARSVLPARLVCTCRNLARLSAAISSASSICFL